VFSVLQFTDPDYPFGIFIRFLLVLSGVRIVRSLVFCVMFCRSVFVLLSFYFCHFVVSTYLLIMVSPLVSSSSTLTMLYVVVCFEVRGDL
jgi:hypothetical protein